MNRLLARTSSALCVLQCVLVLVGSLACTSCGDGSNNTRPSDNDNPYGITATGPGVLSVAPLDTSTIYAISPLGALAPPGHVLPTDHVYISFVNPWSAQQQNNDCRERPLRAAGSGVVTFVLVTEAFGDTKVDIQMTKSFHYVYDHVRLKPGVTLGTRVNAGDTIGTTNGRCPSMDLGVWDADVTAPGLVNTARYAGSSLHVVSPLRYFSEPLRTFMYGRVRMIEGVPGDQDGRTDTTAGVLSVAPTDPDPATISTASDIVAYTGTPTLGLIAPGWILVQMVSDERLRIEYFAATSIRPSGFTGAVQEYVC